MSARQFRREAERRERKALRRAGGMILFHGTDTVAAASIRREGLIVCDAIAPFLTDDPVRAEGYAMRACCLHLYERGLAARPALAPLGAVITFTAASDEIVADRAHAGDWAAPDGLQPARIVNVRLLDLREQIPSADVVADQARQMLHARATERQLAVWRPYSQTLSGVLGIAEAALQRAREAGDAA